MGVYQTHTWMRALQERWNRSVLQLVWGWYGEALPLISPVCPFRLHSPAYVDISLGMRIIDAVEPSPSEASTQESQEKSP